MPVKPLLDKSMLLGVLAGILGFSLLILLLNYLKVLPLSRLYPKQFGFLPQISSQKTSNTPKTTTLRILSCPLDQDPCPKTEAISQATNIPNFYGLGYINLPANAKVLAVIDGQYELKEASGKGDQAKTTLTITSSDQNIQITYYFQGTAQPAIQSGSNAKVGQVIGTLGGKTRGQKVFGKLYNLIISAQQMSDLTYLKLVSVQDGISLQAQ